MHIRENKVPTRREYPGKLRDHRHQIRHVRQCEAAQHDVLRPVVNRKFMQVSDKSRVGLSVTEHLRRTVDGDDAVAAFDQEAGETSGAASSVERTPRRDGVEDRRDVGLVSERGVLTGVIRRCPARITVSRGELRYLDPLGQAFVRQQRTNFSEPRFDELAIMLAGERAEQRRAFDADEVSEGMLVTHACGR